MWKRAISLRFIFGGFTVFLAFLFTVELYGKTMSVINGRSDRIVIDLPDISDGNQMPGVTFYHDLHTDYLSTMENSCSECHLKESVEKGFVFKYMRIKDSDTKSDMKIYHEGCIGCHTKVKKEGKKSGPLEAQCRECHTNDEKALSSWSPIKFDKSLHYRHEKAPSITSSKKIDFMTSTPKEKEPNCSACHHLYDEKSDNLYYEAGTEESCRYCHLSDDKEKEHFPVTKQNLKIVKQDSKISSMAQASHNACVNCHFAEIKKFAGPIDCKGCHDSMERKKISKEQYIPRLDRKQPDLVMISGLDLLEKLPQETIKENLAQYMNPVPFNHKIHELNSKNCRTCHHDSLKSCRSCCSTHPAQKFSSGNCHNISSRQR